MNVLVTGGMGYIGSHTVKLLLKNNHNVIIIDNLSNSNSNQVNDQAKFYNIDLKNKLDINKVFEVIVDISKQITIRPASSNDEYLTLDWMD